MNQFMELINLFATSLLLHHLLSLPCLNLVLEWVLHNTHMFDTCTKGFNNQYLFVTPKNVTKYYPKYTSISNRYTCEVRWKITQLCLTLFRVPMDCSPPSSSVHGILQARILEWVAISFSSRYSHPKDWNWVSCITGRFITLWTTRECNNG